MHSNVLPLHLKEIFPPIIWIFTEGEGIGIESRLPFKIFSTLPCLKIPWPQTFFLTHRRRRGLTPEALTASDSKKIGAHLRRLVSFISSNQSRWGPKTRILSWIQRWENLIRYFQFVPVIKNPNQITIFGLKYLGLVQTGKSVSEALILELVTPQYDERLSIEFPEKYTFITCCVKILFWM